MYFWQRLTVNWSWQNSEETYLGRSRFHFSNDEVVIESERGYFRLYWQGVQGIEETEDYFFLLFTGNTCSILPKRDIQSPATIQELKAYVEIHIKQAEHPDDIPE